MSMNDTKQVMNNTPHLNKRFPEIALQQIFRSMLFSSEGNCTNTILIFESNNLYSMLHI